MKRNFLAAALLSVVALPAEPMACVPILQYPDPYLGRCLGEPPVRHKCNYWLAYGMRLYVAPGFTATDPIVRVRCGDDPGIYKRLVLFQPYITRPSGRIVPLDSDIFHFNHGECQQGQIP